MRPTNAASAMGMEGNLCLGFPPTRKVLWDRTARGPARHICIDMWEPTVSVSAHAVCELAHWLLRAGGAPGVGLVARCGTWGRGRLSVCIDRFSSGQLPEELSSNELAVRCFSRLAEPCHGLTASDAQPSVGELQSAMEARDKKLERPGPLCPAAFLAWAAVVAVDAQDRRAHLRVSAAFPRWVFAVTLLATPLRTLHTPLLTELLNAGRKTPLGWGFLTLDLGRRVVCLLETDDLAQRVPIVGVWLDLIGCIGQEQTTAAAFWDAAELLDNPMIWAAAARFVHSKRIGERVWVGDRTFLMMVVHHTACDGNSSAVGQTCSSFFEAQYSNSANEAVLLAPADGSQAFSIDAPISIGSDHSSPQSLSVRLAPLADVMHIGRRPENPEEDVPERARPSCNSSHAWLVEPARSPCLSESKNDVLLANLEKPRAMPPRPHPGPGQLPIGGLTLMQKMLSFANADTQNSPERSEGRELARRPQPENIIPALENAVELKNSLQEPPRSEHRSDSETFTSRLATAPLSTASVDSLRLSNASRDLKRISTASPSASLPLESCPTSTLGNQLEDIMRAQAGFGAKLDKAPWQTQQDGDENLRKLVTMQQVQLTEMQRQISDLHALVAGMAKGNQLLPASAATEPASDSRAPAAEVATSTSSEVDFQSGGSCGSRCAPQPELPAAAAVLTASLDAVHHKMPRRPNHQGTQVGQSLEFAAAHLGGVGAAHCRDAAVNTSMDRPPTMARSCSAAVNTSLELSSTSQCAASCQHRIEAHTSAQAPQVAKEHTFCEADSRLAAVWEAPTATTLTTDAITPITSSAISKPLGCGAGNISGPSCTAAHFATASMAEGVSEESDLEDFPLVLPDSIAAECKASTVAYMRDSADSADTAGGATPRKPAPSTGSSGPLLSATAAPATAPPACASSGGTASSLLHQDVPRILWPPSPSSCSDSSLEDDAATSDVGSIDSSPALGLSLGLGGYSVPVKNYRFA